MSSELPTTDELLGVIWSNAIRKGGGLGYGLVVTREKFVGAKKRPWLTLNVTVYLGPGSRASSKDVEDARKAAGVLTSEKEIEVRREAITRLTYKAPGLFTRGHLRLESSDVDAEFMLAAQVPDVGVANSLGALVPTLLQFAPDRFYDENTGALVSLRARRT